jgi:two-component system chemotaxis sensor kinase CheA
MTGDNRQFFEKLLSTFNIEANEHIHTVVANLMELEKKPDLAKEKDALETICREVHSLKGASRAVNRTDIEKFCQEIEHCFASIKKQQTPIASAFDTLYHAFDLLKIMVNSPQGAADELTLSVVQSLYRIQGVSSVADIQPIAPKCKPVVDSSIKSVAPTIEPLVQENTVRVSTARLDALLLQAEEMLAIKSILTQRSFDLTELSQLVEQYNKQWGGYGRKNTTSKPVNQRLMEEWLGAHHAFMNALKTRCNQLSLAFEQDQRSVSPMVDSLLDSVKKTVMLPFETILRFFPKMARDISTAQGKRVELIVQGGEVEMDKRILEEIKEPLIHIVRNCVDHGIETVQVREKLKKPLPATIQIVISQLISDKVEITLSDDGAGIDVEKVKNSAVQLGFLSIEDAAQFTEKDALALILESGFSTQPTITEISGRGLGLAIVREKVERLNGQLTLQTEPGKGARFRIVLPLTLSAFLGIIVRASGKFFVIPVVNTDRVLRVDKQALKKIENAETITLEQEIIPILRLSETLAIPAETSQTNLLGKIPVVVISVRKRRIGLVVDEVVDAQEVFVRRLGKQLTRARAIVGATVLASGKVALILNVEDLIKRAVELTPRPIKSIDQSEDGKKLKQQAILVVEDSITSRMLLKNILEANGYRVWTATDGVEALKTLENETIDCVITDIEMPRMNGFELIAKIRDNPRLAELPTILVTSLETREDRRRGMDAGANVYLLKSRFEQDNLLEIVRRLL